MHIKVPTNSTTHRGDGKVRGHVTRLAYAMEEAASSLGISRTAMYELVKARKIQVVKIGRRTLVPVSQVEALMVRLQEQVA